MKKNLQKMALTIPTIPIAEGTVNPEDMVRNIINYALFFIGALAVGFVIYGGVLFVTSGGDAEKTTQARNTLLYAIIGVVVVVLAFAIVNWASGLGGTFNKPTP